MNTRFNPTLNSEMHIGHLYMCLVNAYVAHSNGGKFLVRFDDNQFWWNHKYTREQTNHFAEMVRQDLSWMGVFVDEWTYQSNREDEVDTMLMKLNRGPLPVISNRVSSLEGPKSHYSTSVPYPFAPDLTAEKVILDFMDEINPLIRGEDLVGEASLYDYFCRLWRLPRPEQHYLPRLRIDGKNGPKEISKTLGNMSIRSLKAEGKEPNEIISFLAAACLKDPRREWSIDNIKLDPSL